MKKESSPESTTEYKFFSEMNSAEYDEEIYTGLPKKIIFIASTPRVGSTLLSHGLMDIGLSPTTTEFFNVVHRRDFKARWGNLSKEEYLTQLFRHRTNSSGIFCVKAHYSQFKGFKDIVPINNCHFILIERENKILQAISLFRGYKTGAWASVSKDMDTLSEDGYEFNRILSCLTDILNQNVEWINFFNQNNVTPIHVIYEDFEKNYRETLIKIAEEITQTTVQINEIPPPELEKQRDELTDIFYEKFIGDLLDRNPVFLEKWKHLLFGSFFSAAK
ncbi:hypothetical protein LJC19_03080 [Oxalobacter sp. OttesenSCG-928-P03]|nr:hypothetical protein [Oxalobacter sp. OttesenSCG-928-P03]